MKIGILLSGCGVYDGAEIQESVLTMLALDEIGAKYICISIDAPQHHVINHLTGEEMHESRNMMIESAGTVVPKKCKPRKKGKIKFDYPLAFNKETCDRSNQFEERARTYFHRDCLFNQFHLQILQIAKTLYLLWTMCKK